MSLTKTCYFIYIIYVSVNLAWFASLNSQKFLHRFLFKPAARCLIYRLLKSLKINIFVRLSDFADSKQCTLSLEKKNSEFILWLFSPKFHLFYQMPPFIYIYIVLVLTKSLCKDVSNQVQYNMESAQYLEYSYSIIIINKYVVDIYIFNESKIEKIQIKTYKTSAYSTRCVCSLAYLTS